MTNEQKNRELCRVWADDCGPGEGFTRRTLRAVAEFPHCTQEAMDEAADNLRRRADSVAGVAREDVLAAAEVLERLGTKLHLVDR